MHGVHRQKNRAHQAKGLLLGERLPGLPHITAQVRSFYVIHDQIGCAVLRHIIPVAHDTRHVRKAGQQIGLFPESAQGLPEIPSFLSGQGRDLQALPAGETGREKFLDGCDPLFCQVHRKVCDSEAADSDSSSQQIASRQNRKNREFPAARRSRLPGKTAAGTGPFRILPEAHTARTQMIHVKHGFQPPFSERFPAPGSARPEKRFPALPLQTHLPARAFHPHTEGSNAHRL